MRRLLYIALASLALVAALAIGLAAASDAAHISGARRRAAVYDVECSIARPSSPQCSIWAFVPMSSIRRHSAGAALRWRRDDARLGCELPVMCPAYASSRRCQTMPHDGLCLARRPQGKATTISALRGMITAVYAGVRTNVT